MNFIESSPSIEEYYPLYLSTGWDELLILNKSDIKEAIKQSFACVSAYHENELVGFGRVVSDGVIYAAIYDVIVHPGHMGKGIGTKIVKKLLDKCVSHNIRSIHLFAAEGTEPFYSNLGFVRRPKNAPGMKYYPTKA